MIRGHDSWIQTFSGRQFWPLDPRPEDVCIEDIAHALSNICRFNGHTRRFYSVAQHGVLVSYQARRLLQEQSTRQVELWGLLHDASEAYICNVTRPLKKMPEFLAYREAEARLQGVICDAFGLPREESEVIKQADNILLRTELRDLMGEPPRDWQVVIEPMPKRIIPMPQEEAEDYFLRRFKFLTSGGTP